MTETGARLEFLQGSVLPGKIAVFDDVGKAYTYGDLRTIKHEGLVRGLHGLVVIPIGNQIDCVAWYLVLIDAGIPVMLVDESISESNLQDLLEVYRPSHLISRGAARTNYRATSISLGDWSLFERVGDFSAVHPDLGLMLATSGSTGNPKFVRLSHHSVRANARDISRALGIEHSDIAMTSLPCSYSYGLSILNSHIVSGASVLVTDRTVVDADFWKLIEKHSVCSFAGVPTTYTLLRKMRWSPQGLNSLKYATQAGGRLHDDDREYFLDLFSTHQIDFIVMYGQTEATARMTTCAPEVLSLNISSVGHPIPNGSFEIQEKSDAGVGSVIYRGPNVMMGYAESGSDLSRGDDLGGVLITGDLGYLKDGILFLTGREKRIAKVFGLRIALDDVDIWLREFGNGICVQGKDRIEVFLEGRHHDLLAVRSALAARLGIHPSGVNVNLLDAFPLLPNGKIDLQRLSRNL